MADTLNEGALQAISISGERPINDSVNDAELTPFSGMMLLDPNQGDIDTASIVLSDPLNGALADPTAETDGSVSANGVWIVSGLPASIQSIINGLTFSPTAGLATVTFPVTTTISAVIVDPAGQTASASTEVVATITPPRPPTPPPVDDPEAGTYVLPHDYYQYGSSGANTLEVVDLATGTNSRLTEGQSVTFSDGIAIADPNGSVGEVVRLYQAAFDRLPTGEEASGVNFWQGLLQQGYTLQDVSMGFTTTPEYAAHYAGTTNDQFIDDLYSNVLGRAGDPGGEAFWQVALQSGEPRATVLMQFAESAENEMRTKATSGASDAAEIMRLYQAALHRSPDTDGLSFWQGLYDQGITLHDIAVGMQSTTEYQATYAGTDNDQFVRALYQNVLGTKPQMGDSGVAFWDGLLASGTSRADVLVGFSDSLQNRFQTSTSTHDGLVFLGS